MVPREGHLEVSMLFHSHTVTEIEVRVLFESSADCARCEGLINGSREKFEPKFLHGVMHLEKRCKIDFSWLDNQPLYEEDSLEGLGTKQKMSFCFSVYLFVSSGSFQSNYAYCEG